MKNSWQRFWHLSKNQKKLFFITFYWMIFYSCLIRFCSFKKLKKHLQNSHLEKTQIMTIEIAHEIQQAIYRVRRYFSTCNPCLANALVAKKLLAKRCIDSSLYLGVMKEAGQLRPHAWLISDGIDVIGCEDKERYQIINH